MRLHGWRCSKRDFGGSVRFVYVRHVVFAACHQCNGLRPSRIKIKAAVAQRHQHKSRGELQLVYFEMEQLTKITDYITQEERDHLTKVNQDQFNIN